MSKIINDKYYTKSDLAKYCVEKTKEVIGENNITEYLEPSGGGGVFLDYLPTDTYSCDIEPEDSRITKQNYLDLQLDYKQGRCIIGNPPFGEKGNLCIQFYKKSIQLGDYISFIFPISQYKNTVKCFEFDLVYSEDLGKQEYSDRTVHCCLNIYKRNPNGLNKKDNYKLNDVEIIEFHRSQNPKRQKLYSGFQYDYAICAWGASVGKQIGYPQQYAKEFYFKINKDTYKDEILELLKTADWIKEYPSTATPNLLHWQVYKYLKSKIPALE
jgi:hypothetical protein